MAIKITRETETQRRVDLFKKNLTPYNTNNQAAKRAAREYEATYGKTISAATIYAAAKKAKVAAPPNKRGRSLKDATKAETMQRLGEALSNEPRKPLTGLCNDGGKWEKFDVAEIKRECTDEAMDMAQERVASVAKDSGEKVAERTAREAKDREGAEFIVDGLKSALGLDQNPEIAEHKSHISKQTIYLAGAIHHASPVFATGWRKRATRELSGLYEILDPTQGKMLNDPACNTTLYTPKEIVEADLAMIDKADILLAEISRSDVPYIGTSMEIRYAHETGKIVIIWGGCQSYWARYHADIITNKLDEALSVLLLMARVRGAVQL